MITKTKHGYYEINLMPLWLDFECDGERIDEFIYHAEDWNDEKNHIWVWRYDPDFEYQNAGVMAIVFSTEAAALLFESYYKLKKLEA